MAGSGIVFRCQYFQTNSIRICSHWSCPSCSDSSADFYPNCNGNGTRSDCSNYNPTGSTSLCILPDPSSHSCNRSTGTKWTCSEVTGYNSGLCDGEGTAVDCSGYTPQHMAFGPVVYSEDGLGSTFNVPLNYKILNVRAFLSPCVYWDGPPEYFIAEDDSVTGPAAAYCNEGGKVFKMLGIDFKCTKGGTDEYEEHTRSSLPCNGASTACPHYTGICWKYCTNDRLLPGNKVYAEQVLELRYYLREYRWTQAAYDASFVDSTLYPWGGSIQSIPNSYGSTEDSIPVVETSLILPEEETSIPALFEDLLQRVKGTVSPGTSNAGGYPSYPDLVKYQSLFNLVSPQVQVRFESYSDGSGAASLKYVETNKDINPTIAIYGKYSTSASKLYCIDLKSYIDSFGNPGVFSTFRDFFEFYNYLLTTITSEADLTLAIEGFNSEIETAILNCNLYQGTNSIIYTNTFNVDVDPKTRSAFWFNATLAPGWANILVLQKIGINWTFTREQFLISFVGGLLYQTDFQRRPQTGEVLSYLPDYAKSLGTDIMSVSFTFCPIANNIIPPEDPVYYYNDFMGIEALLPGDSTERYHYTGHNRFIARKSFICVRDFITQLGSSAYYVVEVPDLLLTDAICSWVTGDINFTLESESFEGEFVSCGLLAGLAPNQALIKLKNDDGFSLCNGVEVSIENVECVIKETWSGSSAVSVYEAAGWELMSCYKDADQYNDWESIFWTAANKINPRYQIKESGELSGSGSNVTCVGFETTLALSCLVKGFSGKIVGHSKTKALIWVKQPFCPDVEIQYAHSCPATRYWNYPYCFCWSAAGPMNPFYKRDVSYKELPDKKSESRNVPPCGDHSGTWQWYPYVQCASFSQYPAGANNAYSSRGEVKGAYRFHGHGIHDIRMECSDRFSQFVSLYCPPWNCFCTQLTGNWHMEPEQSVWAGSARIQGEITDNTLVRWIELGASYGTSVLPKFGNVLRSFMRSYRSTDRVEYVIQTIRGVPERETRWLPVPSDYDDIGIYQERSEFHNTNMTSEGPYPTNQLGLSLLTLETGVASPFELYSGVRLRQEEVFSRFDMGAVVYPAANFAYSKNNPGYEFNSIGEEDEKLTNVRWAWKELQRSTTRSRDPLTNISFIKVEYPYYMLDMNRFEHRLGIDEGEATISFIPPTFDEHTGAILNPPSLQLNDGPVRFFDQNGVFDVEGEGEESITQAELYKSCTSGEWLGASTLFNEADASDSTSAAEDDDRKIQLFIAPTESVITRYYNRGLYVTFGNLLDLVTTTKGLNYLDLEQPVALPGKKSFVSVVSQLPSCVPTPTLQENDYSGFMFDTVVNASQSGLYSCSMIGAGEFVVSLIFETPATVRGVELVFETGEDINSLQIGATTNYKEKVVYTYDTPVVSIIRSQKDQALNSGMPDYSETVDSRYGFGEVTSGANVGYSTCRLERPLYFSDFLTPSTTYSFRIRTTPTPEEIASNYKEYYNYIINNTANADKWLFIRRVVCKSIKVITSTLSEVVEPIYIYERKYLVSTGGVPTESVSSQTYDEESVLDLRSTANTSLVKQPDDDSTVWMRERDGVTIGHETEAPAVEDTSTRKVYASKTRTRFVGKFYEKAKPLQGNVPYLESKQKSIFDDIVNGDSYMVATSIVPPNTQAYLESKGLGLVNVPGGCNFNLYNTIRPIGTVVSYPIFNSEGYKIEPGEPYHQNWLGVCWDYALVNKDTGATMYGGGGLAQLNYFAWGAMATIWRYQSFRAYAALFRMSDEATTGSVFSEEEVKSYSSVDRIRPFIHQAGSNYSLAQYYQYTFWGNYETVQRMNIGPGWQTLWYGHNAALAAYAMGYDIVGY